MQYLSDTLKVDKHSEHGIYNWRVDIMHILYMYTYIHTYANMIYMYIYICKHIYAYVHIFLHRCMQK